MNNPNELTETHFERILNEETLLKNGGTSKRQTQIMSWLMVSFLYLSQTPASADIIAEKQTDTLETATMSIEEENVSI